MQIDLNSDLGEGFGHWSLGDDDALLDIVTSANVACGFHAGDPSIMRRVCEHAVRSQVAIGAQVGYPDLAGFGRRFMDVDPVTLAQDVIYQIGALDAFARVAGSRVRYIKPHGALYHATVHSEEQAGALVQAVLDYDPSIAVLGMPASALLRRAEHAGLRVVREAFADRAYRPDGTLLPRSEPHAVLREPAEVARRCVAMAMGEPVADVAGGRLVLDPESICVHGDTAGAVEIARTVKAALVDAGVTVTRFTG